MTKRKLTQAEKNWLALYQSTTGFEAFEADLHNTFEERARASLDWFQMWSDEAISASSRSGYRKVVVLMANDKQANVWVSCAACGRKHEYGKCTNPPSMTNHPKFTESHDSAARSVGYEGAREIR